MSVYRNKSKPGWSSYCLVLFVRFWGVIAAAVTCGVGVDVLVQHHLEGLSQVAASFVILFLETAWIVPFFLKLCFRDETNRVFSLWDVVIRLKPWKKSFIYFAFSVALLLKPRRLWLSSVAAAILFILALLHLLMFFRSRKENAWKGVLLNSEEIHRERSEEVIFEVLDNSFRPKEETGVEEPGGNVLDI